MKKRPTFEDAKKGLDQVYMVFVKTLTNNTEELLIIEGSHLFHQIAKDNQLEVDDLLNLPANTELSSEAAITLEKFDAVKEKYFNEKK